ncbi:aspartate racemase [Brumimicrobium salinarum]|uniref:Aspartate racemase n=1 Tax=Brumimicrobium salinarum TaxID=2058658 RepID=A0A2I0R097_9FLAO|nr:amino acid racemase [Brumimicrobium salinarum]PKR79810.1 aspartate racemase [Brumimicrobium salinarum]
MKKLGLIGGTSYHSTIDYYRMINEKVGEEIGKDQNPVLLLHSLNIALMRSGDAEKIKNEYLKISKELISIGAEGILICANTPHMVYDFVQPKIEVPILHIGKAIGDYAIKNNFNNLALFGTKPTVKKKFLENYLKDNYPLEITLPDEENIDKVHHYISKELTQGVFSKEAKSYFLEQMKVLQAKGADAMILGCTELPMLIKQDETDFKLIDTTGLHVDLAVDFILDD